MKSPFRLIFLSGNVVEYMNFSEVAQEATEDLYVVWAKDVRALKHLVEGNDPEQPDMLFIDIRDSSEKGLDNLKEIKEHEILRDIPTVIFSGTDDFQIVNEAYASGANLYVKEPNTFYRLKAILQEILMLNWKKQKSIPRELFVVSY